MIYETVVYDGATKVFRILNLKTGTVYSMDYETQEQAYQAIEDGEERAGDTVKRVNLFELRPGTALDSYAGTVGFICQQVAKMYDEGSGDSGNDIVLDIVRLVDADTLAEIIETVKQIEGEQ